MKYILSRRVDLKYLDPIHGSKCISLFPSRSFFNLNRSRKISSVCNWNSSRSSCKGGKFDELSRRK